MTSFILTDNEGDKAITIYGDGGKQGLARGDNPHFEAIVTACVRKDFDTAFELIDLSTAVRSKFERLSERVTVRNGTVYFDGDAVHNAITDQIVRFLDEGHDFMPLVNFMERIAQNPNNHSRDQLYNWLDAHDFPIMPNGNFIGYKGVQRSGDRLLSIHSGSAIVNGVERRGQIENSVGATIEMPRSEVAFDPTEGCSYGLHVGTWSYARSFAQGAILEVEVDPRDVVSVPTDCGHEKLRTCRYKVLDEIDAPIEEALAHQEADDDWGYSDWHEGGYDCDCEECLCE